MADDDILEGEFVALDDEPQPDVEDTPDGGAIVKLDDNGPRGDSPFYENLAEVVPYDVLQNLGAQYVELIGRDKESRKKRDEQYEMGIRRTGLGDDAPGGAQFEGASRVVHPLLTEVCVDFAARAIKELFPPAGPAKTKIEGEQTKERLAKAGRKSSLMNWQLTTQSPEFRSELEQLLTQLPLGGAQYLKATWDEGRKRPNFLFIPIDDMLLPFAATNFYAAERKTHVQYLTKLEYDKRVKDGMYVDADLPSAGGMPPEMTSASTANDRIEGRTDSSFNQDGLRTVFECDTLVDIGACDPEADGVAPYILSIDKTTGRVLSLYRNWAEEDENASRLEWTIEFPFVPWRGAYPIGITHMIGGLSGAATGALRALLDSAFIQNSQTMLKLKGGTSGGQDITLQPTQVAEIEGGLNVDDIRKLAMPLPYNPPSATLFQLLGFLVDAGKGVVRTTLDEVSDGQANAPVGTTLAKIEQGMVVFSAIHGRLHNAVGRLLLVLNRLNGRYLDDEAVKKEVGEVLASRADFNGPLDVVPVSDPNIFSEAQRFAQIQAVAQRAQLLPQLYDARKVEERILATLKIPDAAGLLVPGQTPVEENAVAENVKTALGRPVLAFPEQDHIAHLKAHLSFMVSPVFGMSQLIAPQLLPVMLNHIKEHVVLWYASEVFETASDVMTGDDLEAKMKATKVKKDKQALDRLIAEASLSVVEASEQAFATLPPVIAQAMQLMQQLAPQMPQDPAAQVAMADVQMREKLGSEKNQIEGQKVALKGQELQGKQQTEAQRLAADQEAKAEQRRLDAAEMASDDQLEAEDIAARERMNTQDNETILQVAGVETAHDLMDKERQRLHDAGEGERERQHAARVASAKPDPKAGD